MAKADRAAVTVLLLLSFGSTLVSAQQLDRITREKFRDMLHVTADDVQKHFYDPSLKGLDWKSLTAQAEEKIASAKSASEAITAVSLLVDKLDDSHTRFIPPSRANRPLFGFDAKMFGGDCFIYRIKPGGAADQAGLRLGDRIVQIFNYRPSRASFDDAMIYYHLLHPMPQLQITYQRGSEAPQTVVVQAKIKQGGKILDFTNQDNIDRYIAENDFTERYFYGTFDNDIGYMEIPSFAAGSLPIPDVENPKALVIDLRGNPGGRLDTLRDYAGDFAEADDVLVNEIGRKKTEPVRIKPHGHRGKVPMVILVDSRSASAAEIFARYFQKTGRAKIVGDSSSGRVNASLYYSEKIGTDTLLPFGVQIAVDKVAFADGEELEHHPIVPDYPCLPTPDDLRAQTDPCLKMAISLARNAAGKPGPLPDTIAYQVQKLVEQQNEYIAEQLKQSD